VTKKFKPRNHRRGPPNSEHFSGRELKSARAREAHGSTETRSAIVEQARSECMASNPLGLAECATAKIWCT